MIWCYEWPSMAQAIHKWEINPSFFEDWMFTQWIAIKPDEREELTDYLEEFENVTALEFVREGEILKCRIVVRYSELLSLRDTLDIFGNTHFMEVLG